MYIWNVVTAIFLTRLKSYFMYYLDVKLNMTISNEKMNDFYAVVTDWDQYSSWYQRESRQQKSDHEYESNVWINYKHLCLAAVYQHD